MKLSIFTILASVLSAGSVFASGKLVMTGTAEVGQKPDFMQVTVAVASKCYTTPTLAAKTNGAIAQELKDLFSTFVKTEKDQVLVFGGFTNQQTLTSYEDGTTKTLCSGYFQTNNIVLKIADITIWPDLQSKVVAIAEKVTASTSGPHTTVTLEQPTPQLYPETLKALEVQALSEATVNATTQMQALAKACGLSEIQITEMVTGNSRPIAYAAEAKDLPGNAPDSPQLSFDQQWVQKSITFTWTFEKNNGFCALSHVQGM